MRTFQFSDAKSHKFWSIEVTGNQFTVTYGKVGTAGQTSTKTFLTPEKAQEEAAKLIKEKTGKGYQEVTQKSADSDAEAMELAVIRNPHDRATRAAFADFLTERGDPLGEFVRLQLALEDESLPAEARKKLAKTEKELLQAQRQKLGDWAKVLPEVHHHAWDRAENNDPTGGQTLVYEGGLLTTINIGELTMPLARALLKAGPDVRFVCNLFVGSLAYDEDEEEEETEEGDAEPDNIEIPENANSRSQYVLVRWPQLRNIRRFIWGWPADPHEELPSCHMDGDLVYDFVKQMPEIEELRISAHVRDANKLVALPMPNLRVFQLDHGWSFPLDKLAANKTVGNLEEISCHPHGLEYGDKPYIQIKQLKAICAAPHLTKLRLLRLRNATFGDDGAKELVDSGKLKTLKVLDFRNGCLSDAGAKRLAECPDFKNLEFFEVSNNALTHIGIQALESTGVKIHAEGQHTQTKYDDDDGENQFLWAGDAE